MDPVQLIKNVADFCDVDVMGKGTKAVIESLQKQCAQLIAERDMIQINCIEFKNERDAAKSRVAELERELKEERNTVRYDADPEAAIADALTERDAALARVAKLERRIGLFKDECLFVHKERDAANQMARDSQAEVARLRAQPKDAHYIDPFTVNQDNEKLKRLYAFMGQIEFDEHERCPFCQNHKQLGHVMWCNWKRAMGDAAMVGKDQP